MCLSCREAYHPKRSAEACVFCGTRSEQGRTCLSCRPNTFLDGCVSVGWYADPVLRRAIGGWKYGSDRAFEELVIGWLRGSGLFARLPRAVRTVSSAPLHDARRRERGFDQAEVIARCVADILSAPYEPLLRRTHWTEPQARRGHSDRQLGDLDGIFVCSRRPPDHVLLCDDVVTTAATLDAAAQALKAAGTQTVWALTLAHSRKTSA